MKDETKELMKFVVFAYLMLAMWQLGILLSGVSLLYFEIINPDDIGLLIFFYFHLFFGFTFMVQQPKRLQPKEFMRGFFMFEVLFSLIIYHAFKEIKNSGMRQISIDEK